MPWFRFPKMSYWIIRISNSCWLNKSMCNAFHFKTHGSNSLKRWPLVCLVQNLHRYALYCWHELFWAFEKPLNVRVDWISRAHYDINLIIMIIEWSEGTLLLWTSWFRSAYALWELCQSVTRLVKSTGLVVISLHPTGFAMPRASSKPFIPIPFNAVCWLVSNKWWKSHSVGNYEKISPSLPSLQSIEEFLLLSGWCAKSSLGRNITSVSRSMVHFIMTLISVPSSYSQWEPTMDWRPTQVLPDVSPALYYHYPFTALP